MTIKNNPADDVISIIVPCFNEESVLPAFYSAVSDAASSIEGAVCEFLFIDDGSSDRTAEILQHFTEKDEVSVFLHFPETSEKKPPCTPDFKMHRETTVYLWTPICSIRPLCLKTCITLSNTKDTTAVQDLERTEPEKIRSARSYPALSIT